MDDYLNALRKRKSIVPMKTNTHFSATRQIVYRRIEYMTGPEISSVNPMIIKERVIDSLMEYALENMKSFNSVIRKDFGIQCNTVDCYRALYLYNVANTIQFWAYVSEFFVSRHTFSVEKQNLTCHCGYRRISW